MVKGERRKVRVSQIAFPAAFDLIVVRKINPVEIDQAFRFDSRQGTQCKEVGFAARVRREIAVEFERFMLGKSRATCCRGTRNAEMFKRTRRRQSGSDDRLRLDLCGARRLIRERRL